MALQQLKFYKVTELPLVLSPSSIYFVKKDIGTELIIYMTDSIGLVYYKTRDQIDLVNTVTDIITHHQYLMLRNPNPIYTYGIGALNKSPIRIDYSTGVYKTLEYNNNNSIKKISFFGLYFNIVKTFVYNTNGTLDRITEVVS